MLQNQLKSKTFVSYLKGNYKDTFQATIMKKIYFIHAASCSSLKTNLNFLFFMKQMKRWKVHEQMKTSKVFVKKKVF